MTLVIYIVLFIIDDDRHACIHIDRRQCVVYMFTGSITSARMASSADTKAELRSKDNPITEGDAPPSATEEGDASLLCNSSAVAYGLFC